MQESEIEAALLASVEPVKPPPADGLLARARAEDRMLGLAPKLAGVFGLTAEAATEVIRRIRSGEGRVPGPPGVSFLPVEGAAKCILLVDAGAEYPSHVHAGDETLLVLEGALKDSHGQEVWRGDAVTLPEGSEHSVAAMGGVPCICAVRTDEPRVPAHL